MSTKMQRLFSLMMAVLMMLSLTACGGNATSSTPASVSGSGSESGEQVSEAAKRLEEQKELNIMFVAGNFAESMQKIYADYEKEYGVKINYTILNSVYTRSGQNSTPNSNATNLHSSQKRCCSFCISSSNASPTFQVQKSIFHQMTKPIQVTVILPLLLAISFSRNDDIHSSISGISNDLIGVIPTIGQ